MVVQRVLNNNAVVSRDPSGREVVLLGKGIGFGSRRGDRIQSDQITSLFTACPKQKYR